AAYPPNLPTPTPVRPQTATAGGPVKLVAAIVLLVVAARLLRRAIASTERAINRWDQLKSNDESLARLFIGLDRLIVNTAWMLLAVFACGWFGLPQPVSNTLLIAIRIYLVFSIGLLVIRCT